MTKKPDEDSPINSVGARLALYAVLAGVAAGTVGLAIKRRNQRAPEIPAAENEPRFISPASTIDPGYRLSDETIASVKSNLASSLTAAEPGREGIT
jgi:hypothetical protein